MELAILKFTDIYISFPFIIIQEVIGALPLGLAILVFTDIFISAGMGIGAFESRDFVRSLGGDIQVSSTPGEGSIFRVMLPCTVNLSEPETKRKGSTP